MEKQLSSQPNKQFLHLKNSLLQEQKEKSHIKKLGGIHLYNQDYKRHLNIQSHEHQSRLKKLSNLLSQPSFKQQQQQMVQSEIKDFMQHREQYKCTLNTVFTSQIQSIIHTFKTSHLSTNRFLLQHQNHNEQLDSLSAFSFEELFQCEQNKNKAKYTQLMEKVIQHFKDTVIKQVKKLKIEEINKLKEKQNMRKESSTQTIYDNQVELTALKKDLERKEAEYNALYDYKKNLLNQGQNMIKDYQIRCQFQKGLINKLENEAASKNLQIRGLQSQLKQSQDKLFNKILEVQKLIAINQARSSLSSIQQFLNPNDIIRQNEGISSFLTRLNSKKKRFKQRAESILSITQSLFSNMKDKDDIVASMADVAAKSLREIDVHFDQEINDEFIQQLQKASKTNNSSEAQNLFKILEAYKKNRNVSEKNNHKKTKNKVKVLRKNPPQRNSIQLGAKLQRQYFRGSFKQQESVKSRINSKQSKEKKEIPKPSQRKISKQLEQQQQQSKDYNKSKFISRKLSFQKALQTRPLEITTDPIIKEQKTSILKPSLKELSIIQSKNQQNTSNFNQNIGSRKKIKKGVSFQLQYEQICSKLLIHSKQVNVCIESTVNKQNSDVLATNESIINEKVEFNLQAFDKRRFSKNKLVKTKTKLKQQIHKKATSMLDQQNLSAFGFTSFNNEKNITTQKSASSTFYRVSPFQSKKQRLSYHNSQQKIVNNDIKPKERNSYSRLQRATIHNIATNQNPAYIIPSQNQQQVKIVKQMALKSNSKIQYHEKLVKLHKNCGQNCDHIKRYLQFFDKCRDIAKKENLKLKVQNLNNNIRQNLPALTKIGK